MNATTRGERLRIGLFGRRNAGKSSLLNALAGQPVALVSPTPGTTTDPVSKAMEVLPIGPVLFVDTAGLDDEGELGALRVARSLETLAACDLALVVVSAGGLHAGAPDADGLACEEALVARLREARIPAILVPAQTDLGTGALAALGAFALRHALPSVPTSAVTGEGIEALKRAIIDNTDAGWKSASIVGDLVAPGQTVVLVVPIDNAAPRGRLILPQVETIRDLLDHDAQALVVKERELAHALGCLSSPPALVVTDSQAFQKVAADVPPGVPLTSFSILFARYKGDLAAYLAGTRRIDELADGDRVLVAEGCTHHVQSDDIGTVKLPRWLRELTGKDLVFEKVSGATFPADLAAFRLVIQCGGCMLNRRETLNRIRACQSAGVPITNYGVAIAHSFGILERALEPFPLARDLWLGNIY